jgi:hypothetical protein
MIVLLWQQESPPDLTKSSLAQNFNEFQPRAVDFPGRVRGNFVVGEQRDFGMGRSIQSRELVVVYGGFHRNRIGQVGGGTKVVVSFLRYHYLKSEEEYFICFLSFFGPLRQKIRQKTPNKAKISTIFD